jgi:hypothetical protein
MGFSASPDSFDGTFDFFQECKTCAGTDGIQIVFCSRHHLQVNLVSHDRHHFSETKSSSSKIRNILTLPIQISPPFHMSFVLRRINYTN